MRYSGRFWRVLYASWSFYIKTHQTTNYSRFLNCDGSSASLWDIALAIVNILVYKHAPYNWNWKSRPNHCSVNAAKFLQALYDGVEPVVDEPSLAKFIAVIKPRRSQGIWPGLSLQFIYKSLFHAVRASSTIDT